MNIALIFAGGTGQRMSTRAKPKQFLEVYGKPIIIYTLEHFEEHSEIDGIVVVCLESWIHELEILLNKYDIKKVISIIPGGGTGHDSIFNGLKSIENKCKKDDIVVIHDGVRPLIDTNLISLNIQETKKMGNSITVEAAVESVISSKNGKSIDSVLNRNEMYVAKAPQTFRYEMIYELYQRAQKDGFLTIDSAHLCSLYGVHMHIVKSSPNNIKITTPQDYYIFRALYEAMENQQILGF